MVDALIYGRHDAAVALADFAHRGYLPGHVVADAEIVEEAFLMQLVDLTQRVLVWRLPAWPGEVKKCRSCRSGGLSGC